MTAHFINGFLYPKSIAIYGANNKGIGIGSIGIMNLIRFGFKGQIYPIHPRLDHVFGIKAYKNIVKVPEVPDLVILAIPSRIVPQIFQECGEKGVKYIILISGGFREIQEKEAQDFDRQIQDIANQYGIRFIGPNCLGVYNSWIYPEEEDKLLNMNIWEPLKRGKLSIVSQSGTLSSHIWFDPESTDLGLGKSFSLGNEADVDMVDVLEYLKYDEETEVIGLYIEEIKRGKEFIEIAKQITPKKPIVAIYVGGSKAGNRAIKSHTGSLAGNAHIYDAVFQKAGVIKTELVEEFLDTMLLLSKRVYPKGNRIGILTNSGGPGAMIAHNAEKHDFTVPELSEELQERLKEELIPTASVRNPVDATFDLDMLKYYIKLPKILIESGEIDILIIYGVFGLQGVLKAYLENEQIRKHAEFVKTLEKAPPDQKLEKMLIPPILQLSKKNSIPIIYINPQNFNSDWSKKLRESGALLFKLWDRPIRCLDKLYYYARYKASQN